MVEQYFGPIFNTIFLNRDVPYDARIKKLILWGKKLSLLGLTPAYEFGAAGNLSVRTKSGFIITGARKDLGNLKETDFVEVIECNIDGQQVKVTGKVQPSSETMMHSAVYSKRPDVNVIFHVHDEYVIDRCDELGLKCTANEQPSGSVGLLNEVLKVLDDLDYLVMKNHGIISLGQTVEETGERIIDVNNMIKR